MRYLHLHSFPTRRSSDLCVPCVPARARSDTGRAKGDSGHWGRQPSGGSCLSTDRSVDRHDPPEGCLDRKSTRLNSSHTVTSYSVFCLKKKIKPLASQYES